MRSLHVEGARLTDYHTTLMQHAVGHPNDAILAVMVASWLCGMGSLPAWLGLSRISYSALFERHFPGLPTECWHSMRAELEPGRQDEMGELLALLEAHRRSSDESEACMARIVTVGCMANDHLWQDLGLWSRQQLSELMAYNFPTLKALNDRDMKWKRFLYKQLCITEGIYTCRAPSCEVCADYAACFGPEQ